MPVPAFLLESVPFVPVQLRYIPLVPVPILVLSSLVSLLILFEPDRRRFPVHPQQKTQNLHLPWKTEVQSLHFVEQFQQQPSVPIPVVKLKVSPHNILWMPSLLPDNSPPHPYSLDTRGLLPQSNPLQDSPVQQCVLPGISDGTTPSVS